MDATDSPRPLSPQRETCEEELLAQLGHELRNPLAAITNILAVLAEIDPRNDDPTGRCRSLLRRQVAQLTETVDRMLGDDGGTPAAGLDEETANGDRSGTAAGNEAADSHRSPGEDADGNALRSGRRVLLVEDDPDGRQALQQLLRVWGYTVDVAEDGEDGVEQAAARRPAVALVDIGLPGIDGYEVARRIRHDGLEPQPLLVALTGFGQPEDRERALEAGFDLHLVKPVRPKLLAELLAGRLGS